MSRIAGLDLCNASTESRLFFDKTSSGLAILLRGQEFGKAVEDFVISFHEIRLHTKAVEKVRDDTGYMANELGSLGIRAQGKSMGHAMEEVYHELYALHNKQTAFVMQMKDGVGVGTGYTHLLRLKFDSLIANAEESSTWHGFIDPWFYGSWVGKRWYDHSAATSLTFALVKSSSKLTQSLAELDRSSDKLLNDLQFTLFKLANIEEQLRAETNSAANECNQAREKLVNKSGSKYGYLAEWSPFSSDPVCEKDVLPERCCSSMPSYVEWARVRGDKLNDEVAKVGAVRKSLEKVGNSLLLLRKTAEQGGRLSFWPEERAQTGREAARLRDRLEEVDRTWTAVLKKEKAAHSEVEE